ncbi:MAG: helix-turn-helix domain-containing protein [Planctomycetes bacterium]|nr:helix-turn-helix domain-containing protein [Planctomycetota bacterium]
MPKTARRPRTAQPPKAAPESNGAAPAGADHPVGSRLRDLRASRGLSLRALAERAGVTAGALSQIENGHTSPSVSTLKKLLAALGTTLGAFFAEDAASEPGRFIYRKAELVNVASGNGLRFLALPGPAGERQLQILHETYAPGADTGEEPYAHAGEESGVCLAGTIEITVDGRTELLGPGDAYWYASTLPHRWRNVGRTPAQVVSACTPPTF